MSPGWLMEADCIHGVVWYDCVPCNLLMDEQLAQMTFPETDGPANDWWRVL